MKYGLIILMLNIAGLAHGQVAPFAIRAPAAINRAAVAQANLLSPELIQNFNEVKASMKAFDASQMLPTDLQPSQSESDVFNRIADHSLSNWFNSPEMKATPIGRTATEVEKKVSTDVTITDAKANIDHKVSFHILAFQALAKIDYSGYVNASFKYRATDTATIFELQEPLANHKEVYINHTTRPDDRISEAGVRWSF